MVISEKIHLKGRPQPSILGYHPTNLCYQLIEDSGFLIKHPQAVDGNSTLAVGVHNVVTMVPWESNPGGYRYSGALLWHLAELSNWQETQKEFSSASLETKRKALAVGPVFNKGRWGTHFGGAMSILTSDGYTVFRSRKGKYAETQSYDSILTGTMLTSDISNSLVPNTMDYLLSLLSDANISLLHDVEEFHPTHLAVRGSDFGLWLGGWFKVGLTASQVASFVPFDAVISDLENSDNVPLTEEGEFNLKAMRTHLANETLLPPPPAP